MTENRKAPVKKREDATKNVANHMIRTPFDESITFG